YGRGQGCDSAALLLQQILQLISEGYHAWPFANPHFLADLEKGDRTHENALGLLDQSDSPTGQTRIASQRPCPSMGVEKDRFHSLPSQRANSSSLIGSRKSGASPAS